MEATLDQFETTAESTASPKETMGFFDAMLRDDEVIDDMVCDTTNLTGTIQRLLAIATAGLLLYGLALGTILQMAQSMEILGFAVTGTPIIWMPLTLAGAFLLAIAICLPSFYFYTQLSGLDASFRMITAQSLRVQARTSLVLLGVLPFYLAWGLSTFLGFELLATEIEFVIFAGFILPFSIGLVGLASVYASFRRLVKRLPITHPRRGNIMLRLVLCWGAVMIAVTPVAMFRIGEYLSTVI